MTLGSFDLRTRVVIITDGKPTDFGTENSEDVFESMGLDKVGTHVFFSNNYFCHRFVITLEYTFSIIGT